MTITAKVIAHSAAPDAPDLITLQLRYPRFIHAEFMTHRVFSRNASSSRAVPIERMIQDVLDDPAMPVEWGSNKPGMQAGDEVSCEDKIGASELWLGARDRAVEYARSLSGIGLHKQIVNRLLEPFGHISVVVTATEWDNFFALRRHEAADPTMHSLADAMYEAIQGSTATTLMSGEWHLPYVPLDYVTAPCCARDLDYWRTLAMISAARCARVSYLQHSGEMPDIAKDLALAEKLLEAKHASPFEHQAKGDGSAAHEHEWGNFTGWAQHRKMLGI